MPTSSLHAALVRADLALSRVPAWLLVLAIACLAFAVRLAYLLLTRGNPASASFYEVDNMAISLLTTGIFGNPFGEPTGPSSHAAPILVYLRALGMAVFGINPTGRFVNSMGQALATSLAYGLLIPAFRSLGFPLLTCFGTALFLALQPIRLWPETWAEFDHPLALLLLMIQILLLTKHWRTGHLTLHAAAGLGVAFGIFNLAAPFLMLALVALCAFASWELGWRHTWRFHATILVLAYLITVPWNLRDVHNYGTVMFVRNNMYLELYVSNTPGIGLSLQENTELPGYQHPIENQRERRLLRTLHDPAYQDFCRKRFLASVEASPLDFLMRSIRRAGLYWFSPYSSRAIAILNALYTLIGLGAFLYLALQRSRIISLLLPLWLLLPVPYYLIQHDVRYVTLTWWTLALCISIAATRAAGLREEPWLLNLVPRKEKGPSAESPFIPVRA